MSRSFVRLKIAVLILAAVMLTTTSWAGGLRSAPVRATGLQPHEILTRLGSFFLHLWSEVGCIIDPNGRCLPGTEAASPAAQGDAGCIIDPSGRCLPGS